MTVSSQRAWCIGGRKDAISGSGDRVHLVGIKEAALAAPNGAVGILTEGQQFSWRHGGERRNAAKQAENVTAIHEVRLMSGG